MDFDNLHQKLNQIEEEARLTIDEFPRSLTVERQRMIIALARYLRAELSEALRDLEATAPADHNRVPRGL